MKKHICEQTQLTQMTRLRLRVVYNKVPESYKAFFVENWFYNNVLEIHPIKYNLFSYLSEFFL